jgi:hypothetical protein
MKKTFNDNLFEYDDDVLQCYPIDEKDARNTYRNLIKEKDDLRTRIAQEEHMLDLISDDLINGIMEQQTLIIELKLRLSKIEEKFNSVKKWFHNNNNPIPGSKRDRDQKKIVDEYLKRLKRKNKTQYPEKKLTQKDFYRVLEKLEDDNIELSEKDHFIIKHKSFRAYCSSYIKAKKHDKYLDEVLRN